MSDYKPHPNDTPSAHVEAATESLAKAKPTNRYFIFPMLDRVEIAFGNSRHVSDLSEDGALVDGFFTMDFHSSISMDDQILRDFHEKLGVVLERREPEDG